MCKREVFEFWAGEKAIEKEKVVYPSLQMLFKKSIKQIMHENILFSFKKIIFQVVIFEKPDKESGILNQIMKSHVSNVPLFNFKIAATIEKITEFFNDLHLFILRLLLLLFFSQQFWIHLLVGCFEITFKFYPFLLRVYFLLKNTKDNLNKIDFKYVCFPYTVTSHIGRHIQRVQKGWNGFNLLLLLLLKRGMCRQRSE